ncbi:hypothetical protein N7510_009728 [Penicillium lagena]|uniref:uncharacterized protein n=1 Tax=Penicillium lagena TaxID=94218 RepID=UPI0025422474|nr:uncharacterized protein N7510_009728 [Penicillium lagena]KAJ5604574.1 hypothetical protein N7510_009728 [Penicillium lagena]
MDRHVVLFLTNAELSQANIHLAVAHELLLRPGYDVHIASFEPLRDEVEKLNSTVATLTTTSPANAATFHRLAGATLKEAFAQHPAVERLRAPGFGIRATAAYKGLIPVTLALWDNGADYLTIYHSCVEAIQQAKPTLIAVDPFLAPGIDACQVTNSRFCLLSPNTFLEHIPSLRLTKPWKYPQYTLPSLERFRNANGIPGPTPSLLNSQLRKVPCLLPSRRDTDFPCSIPSNFTCCGPILRPYRPITEENPALATWLARQATVLVNMGSHVTWTPLETARFAAGLRTLLAHRADIQVLWKLQRAFPDGQPLSQLSMEGLETIVNYIQNDRVKVLSWLPVEPISVLQSGRVVCMVHHGGSNSYHEAIRAGVPHVVLPVWLDTYDFAVRVEWLGIGVWGSHRTAPIVDSGDLGSALVRVMASSESAGMMQRAQGIANGLGTEGRVVACEKIVEMVSKTLGK